MRNFLLNSGIFLALFFLALLFHECATSQDDEIRTRRNTSGHYYFYTYGSRIWVSPSFRQGSLSGRRRGGGPHAGK